ncbi:hypothetical protein UFOVP235_6 [uncultured Caudovirales phage]|uniref:Uncharacterized protein n=1 Tax=uncultured Caudovirales phage TaxID=2100421 RepID=A0A6J7WTS0_9CAUD|nr:hypothetical protein UFOVP235_6 [uncultured Caudovirales phage]
MTAFLNFVIDGVAFILWMTTLYAIFYVVL